VKAFYSCAPADIIPDDDLDRKESDKAEARYLIRLLAHRGDGDWTLYYRSGEVDLHLLQQVYKLPGMKLIEQTINGMTSTSAKDKGKGKAIETLDDSGAELVSSGQRSTAYSGVSHFSFL
jgi:hypothetical protein